jgi:CTP synthase
LSAAFVEKGAQTWASWKELTAPQYPHQETVDIVLVGKYTNLHDSYLSVIKSLEHAAMACGKKLNLIWVDASHLEAKTRETSAPDFFTAWKDVTSAKGILVPGGFGLRGTEGMIEAAKYAREQKIPYLGICLGMQIAVIEYARHVCGITNAASIELDERTSEPVIVFMPEIDREHLGGTMRLGLRPTYFQKGSGWSKIRALYSAQSNKTHHDKSFTNGSVTNGTDVTPPPHDPVAPVILERHRHRYEVNPAYIEKLTAQGLQFIGKDDKGERMEIIELKDHPWFVGVQFHPEYLSRVLDPSKPYLGFVAASAGCLDALLGKADTNGAELNGASVASAVKDLRI